MIDTNIIKIAADDKFNGLLDNSNLRASKKNRLCGDKIIIEIIKQKNIIKTMRYETESCIFCQATASLLSKKISLFRVNTIIKDVSLLKNIMRQKNKQLPKKFAIFKKLINYKNISRYDCIMLPFNALIKALKLR
jgi:nitrogen fixation protein NifU and related proteins